jgi:hypothetical protein
MIKCKKTFPVLLVLTLVLALVAMAISAVQFDREKDKELRALQAAKINTDRAALTSAVQKTSPEEQTALMTKGEAGEAFRLDRPSRALISATAPPKEEEGDEEEPALKAAYTTKDHEFGTSSIAGHPVVKYAPASVAFEQDFEGDEFPPPGWDTINTDPGYGFFLGTYAGGGTQAALVTWHAPGYVQDEWLLSPTVNLTGYTSALRLEFWFLKGYSYPHLFKIYVDAGSGMTEIWDSDSTGYPSFTWWKYTIDMSAYIDETVQIGFQYYGEDADLFGIDDIVLTDEAPPVGRCCYGDPSDPDCADVTEEECEQLGGYSWDEGLNCTDNPCPVAPENDDCHDVVPDALPATWTGNNEGATYDTYCQWFGDYPNVWHGFTIDECMDITIEYCGCPAGWANGWLNLITDCDCPDGALISYTSFDWDCANGNPRIYFVHLAAGTYYYPVMLDPDNGAVGDYELYVYGTECPPAQPGDNCDDPLTVDIPSSLPWSDLNQTTCGRTNDYDGTCLGSYDGGEDIIYEVTVSSAVTVNITLDPKGTTWTGVAIGTDCPPTSCLKYSTSSSGDPHGVTCVSLDPGVYYIMVDTWPSPDCIPDFDLHIVDTTCEVLENDDCAGATPVGEVVDLAFSTEMATFDGGGTCQSAPNIWYCYTATEDGIASISLCGSSYDTKMAVYDGCTCDPLGTELGCNDDYCGVQSQVDIEVVAGNSYLVEVGGYSSNTGEGILNIWVSEPCVVECPPGAFMEPEDCGDDTNGGCNMDVPAFTPIECEDTVCGYIWADGGTRDTDWYQLVLTQATLVTWSGVANFPFVIGFVDTADCALAAALDPYVVGDPCDTISCSRVCGPGTYWLFASHQSYYDYPCGTFNDYWCAVSCEVVTEGACCYEDGSCSPDWEEEACFTSGGTSWLGGQDCGPPNPCPQPPCEYECPEGATPEGEVCLTDEAVDNTNGGCNSSPNVFGSISCGETICGEFSTYLFGGSNYRDTDWYELLLDGWYEVTLDAEGGFPIVFGFIEQYVLGVPGCDNITGYISPYALAGECEPASVVATLPAGTYYIFVSGQSYSGYTCADGPWEYGITATCVPAQATYCAAGGGCDEYIERVEVGTIDNSSDCEGYGDFTALSTVMVPGTGYPITITIGNAYSSDDGAVWVDWNQDMDFYDDGERVPLDPETGYGPYLGTVTPPMDAVPGETRMRIRLSYSGLPEDMDPCGTTSYGEVEDYTINVSGEVPVTYLFEPDPVLVMYKYAIDPMNGYIYLSGDAVGGNVNDIDLESVVLKIDDCTVPQTDDPIIIIGGYGELTGDVLKVTFNLTEYILCEEDGSPIFGDIDSFFDVFFDLSGVPGQMSGKVTMRGHHSGDLNLDGSVNVADVTYFVEYLFFGGPAPVIMELADVDGSGGNPNVADLTYLVNYLFFSGPPPMLP